jgi:hypothetical protein
MKIQLNWTNFKSQVTAGTLPYRYLDIDDIYYIYAIDGSFEYETSIIKDGNDDQTDFEATLKPVAFTTFTQFDVDGANVVRIKAAKKGWSFWAVPIEITTSTLNGSVYCKDASGTDVPGITCKIYDINNTEIVTDNILGLGINDCVKTVLDFEPTFDYELIGGALRINSNPSQDIRLWIVGAPDIPAIYGGSKEFASGINLKFLAPDSSFEIDGRVTKYVTYSNVTHSGKIRIILKHPEGLQVNMQLVIHTYRL